MRAFRSAPEAEEKRDGRRSRGEQLKACVIDAERIAGSQAIKKQSANSASLPRTVRAARIHKKSVLGDSI